MSRKRKIYTIENNRKVNAIDLAKELNVNHSTIVSRLNRGKVLISELAHKTKLKPIIEKKQNRYKPKPKYSWEVKKSYKTSWDGPENDAMLKLAMLKI
jgi:IS30 family transposase